jgi:regulator of nonsense transcripts 2
VQSQKLLEQDKRNHEAYIKSGEIFEDRQHAYERMTRAVERLTTGVQSLADLLSLSPPILPTAASLSKSGLQIVESGSSFQVKDDGSLLGGIWDDEEERNFYEELVDLKEVVPASLLGIKEKKEIKIGEGVSGSTETETEDREGEGKAEEEVEEARKRDEEDIRRQLEQLDLQTIQPSEPIDDVAAPGSVDMSRTATDGSVDPGPADLQSKVEDLDAEPTPTAESFAPVGDEDGLSGPAARLTALFAALPEANNREVVDKLAVEFAFLNSKAARKRLVKVRGNTYCASPFYMMLIRIVM